MNSCVNDRIVEEELVLTIDAGQILAAEREECDKISVELGSKMGNV